MGSNWAKRFERVAQMYWRFEDLNPPLSGFAKQLGQKVSQRTAVAMSRYIKYPIKASRLKAEVFHILDHTYSQLLLCLDPRRSVVTCHDLIPMLAFRRLLNVPVAYHIGWTFWLRVRLMKRAAYVIADSESTRRDIISQLKIDPERVVVIANGVSRIFQPSNDRTRLVQIKNGLGLSDDVKIVLNISANNEYKNISCILRAIDVLRHRDSRVRFLRAGGDFSVPEKQLIKKLGISDYVQYVGGPATDCELADLYRLADAFAFPSFYEGFGWPPLEAMRCGTPVVASKAGSLPEVLADAALLVQPEDSLALADALSGLIWNPDLHAEMSVRGVKRASTYTWERTAEQTLNVYQQILREQGPSNHNIN